MTKEGIGRIKELAIRLSMLSAEMLAIFEGDARDEALRIEELKKSPRGIYSICPG